MKYFVLLFFFVNIFICKVVNAQDHIYTYYLDSNLSSVDRSKALILGKGFKEGNDFRLDCFLLADNTKLLTAHFSDSTLNIFDGDYISYYSNSSIETKGKYVSGSQEGLLEKWNNRGQKTDSIIYKNDKIISNNNFSYTRGKLYKITFADSIENTLHEISYDSNGIVRDEVSFKGNNGLIANYKNGIVTTDSIFSRVEKEAEFRGGATAWRMFLQKTLNANIASDNRAPAGNYTVVIKFVITSDGSISDIEAESDPGYGIAKEAIRVIKLSSQIGWIPAEQYGRNVAAFRRQPITIAVEEK